MDFSLFFFSADGNALAEKKYDLILKTAKIADESNYVALWTPERHFQQFGGLYPNPSVLSAALAMLTKRIQLRSGSTVLPLHSPIRVAEEWAVVDNLSNGRVGLAFASGWHSDDFVIQPQNYKSRKELLFKNIEVVKKLWAGDQISLQGADGESISVKTMPRPVQKNVPIWVAATSSYTWEKAGAAGLSILTMLTNSKEQLQQNIKAYRAARFQNGHNPNTGVVTVMLHTYLGEQLERVKQKVKSPLMLYLKTYLEQFSNQDSSVNHSTNNVLLEVAFERYFGENSLLGTREKCEEVASSLQQIGVNEIACLIDFGLSDAEILESLYILNGIVEKK